MEERGLISVKPGRGATINEPDDWYVFDPEFEPVVWTEAERAKAGVGRQGRRELPHVRNASAGGSGVKPAIASAALASRLTAAT
jgi:hypothetical protein